MKIEIDTAPEMVDRDGVNIGIPWRQGFEIYFKGGNKITFFDEADARKMAEMILQRLGSEVFKPVPMPASQTIS